jgi:hypothetical protein
MALIKVALASPMATTAEESAGAAACSVSQAESIKAQPKTITALADLRRIMHSIFGEKTDERTRTFRGDCITLATAAFRYAEDF